MNRTSLHWLGRAFVAVAAAVALAACADDTAVGPQHGGTFPPTAGTTPATTATVTDAAGRVRTPDLTACPKLQVPEGSKLALHVYANGVQIYRWNGTSWSFVAPSAVLTADAAGNGIVGTHYAGPTWKSNGGGMVVGAVVERCTPDANAIQWLKLSAVPSADPGIFRDVDFIQRVNTAGGIAPSTPGTYMGEEAQVPYTTEYLFWRAP